MTNGKTLPADYNLTPTNKYTSRNREIADFTHSKEDANIDMDVVKSFGEEWNKFHEFSKKTIDLICREYFDIIDESIVNKDTYMIDIGCGSGRWSEYFLDKAAFIEAVDPSDAVFAADKLLGKSDKLRITRASINTLPWPDETFDFGMSVGVLHHIPDTRLALEECVKKIKKGGHFYVYIYYKLDNRGILFKSLFYCSDIIRRVVSKMPSFLKKGICDILAVVAYMPFILLSRLLKWVGLKKLSQMLPLSAYANKSFYVIRNDSLDRFGTKLEHRFTKAEIESMMKEAGLTNIRFGNDSAFWHAVGQRS
ncbi:MAG: class I SAM-dependent methyltransferase [Chitinophagaceae bacterium]|nr:class I SAM-dependent methyltransferase [Chitinophagaceae bacterium]